MKILLDTNIIIDNLARRDEYRESLQIMELCEKGIVDGVVTTVTVMDVIYILRKHINPVNVRNAVWMLLQIVDVIPALKNDINIAFTGDFSDFEDAVQASCAARVKADYIVTRNVRDFEKSIIPAVRSEDMLRLLSNQ
ncbi:twitching motility protein PilT [Clostridia bacterium]|nr:twitching motility protein PilT [Clostridia bacterium]